MDNTLELFSKIKSSIDVGNSSSNYYQQQNSLVSNAGQKKSRLDDDDAAQSGTESETEPTENIQIQVPKLGPNVMQKSQSLPAAFTQENQKDLQQFTSGQAQVKLVYQTDQKCFKIIKKFNEINSYMTEKRSFTILEQMCDQQFKQDYLIIPKSQDIFDSQSVIIFEAGQCSLDAYDKMLAANKLKWYTKKDIIEYVTYKMILFVFGFAQFGFFHSDIKSGNIVFARADIFGNFDLRVIDLGGCGMKFNHYMAYTPGFLDCSKHFNKFTSPQIRIKAELFCVYKMIHIMMERDKLPEEELGKYYSGEFLEVMKIMAEEDESFDNDRLLQMTLKQWGEIQKSQSLIKDPDNFIEAIQNAGIISGLDKMNAKELKEEYEFSKKYLLHDRAFRILKLLDPLQLFEQNKQEFRNCVDFLLRSSKFNKDDLTVAMYKKAQDYILSIYSDEKIEALERELQQKQNIFTPEEKLQYKEDIAFIATLSKICEQQQNKDKAIHYRLKLIELNKYFFGENSYDLAQCYNNCSVLLHKYQKLQDSIKYLRECIRIKELYQQNLEREKFIELSVNYSNLCHILQKVGDMQNSLSAAQKAITLQEQHGGHNCIELAKTYNNMSTIMVLFGDYEAALQFQEKSLKIKIDTEGEKNRDTIIGQNNLAYILNQLEMYPKAYDLLMKLQRTAETTLGSDCNILIFIWKNIAFTLIRMGKVEEATEMVQKIEASIQKKSLFDDYLLFNIAHARALILWLKKQFEDAEKMFQEAYRLFSKTCSYTTYDILNIKLDHAQMHLQMKQKEKAREFLSEGLSYLQKFLKPDHGLILKYQNLLKQASGE